MVGFGLGIVSSSVHLKLYGIIGKDEDSAPKHEPKLDNGASRSTQILIRFDWFNSNTPYIVAIHILIYYGSISLH